MATEVRFVDGEGFAWEVAEVSTSSRRLASRAAGAQRLPDRTLYFLSRFATRRLLSYPRDWERLTWKELNRLCALAEPLADVQIPLIPSVEPGR